MITRVDKTQDATSIASAGAITKDVSGKESHSSSELQQIANGSPQVKQFKDLQKMANDHSAKTTQLHSSKSNSHSPASKAPPAQQNNNGLPEQLAEGIENLSGLPMNDVQVHYNSDKPAQLQAHAFAQGTNIHIAPGQEKHLPHEAWHVVQQKQGRVQPTGSQHPVQRVPRVVPAAPRGEGDPIPQTLYQDDRGGPAMINTGGNVYDVSGGGLTVTHLPATDQYRINETTYWDPETGARLVSIGGRNYQAEGGEARYVLSHFHYTAVPELSGELATFFNDIWAIRGEVAGLGTTKLKLKHIYSKVYCKAGENTKQVPAHSTPTITELVAFSAGKNGHIQGGVQIPRGEGEVENINDIALLNTIKSEEGMGIDANIAAYNGLCNQYYYYRIHDVDSNARMILNVSPLAVPAALRRIYPILLACPLVQDMKAAGPKAAASKLDSIVIYFSKGPGHRDLVRAIRDTGVADVGMVPGLTDQKAPGLAVADEPEAVGGVNISFGQKRVILALMALNRADSAELYRNLGGAYFIRAGINPASPAQELAVAHLPNVEAEMLPMLNAWNAR